jgi:hypothetical protein|tara:strand:- start:1315 stop:1740 length:426 start_codon:yes stop_codon:yes gene_type:complete
MTLNLYVIDNPEIERDISKLCDEGMDISFEGTFKHFCVYYPKEKRSLNRISKETKSGKYDFIVLRWPGGSIAEGEAIAKDMRDKTLICTGITDFKTFLGEDSLSCKIFNRYRDMGYLLKEGHLGSDNQVIEIVKELYHSQE